MLSTSQPHLMATSSTASFLSLPSEVRILIYECLLVAPRDGWLRAIVHRPRSDSNKTSRVPPLCGTPKACPWCANGVEHYACGSEYLAYPQRCADRTLMARSGGRVYPSILSVSKLIYKEAMPILYFNLQLSFLITGHDDVHDILKSLPKFPCNVQQIILNICPQLIITSSEKEIMMDAISILEVVLNQYKPTILSGIFCKSAGNNQEICQGVAHEIFRRCGLMRTKEPLAVMSEAKRASLCRNMKPDIEANNQITATLNKFYGRQDKKCRDDVPNWLEESHSLRQNI